MIMTIIVAITAIKSILGGFGGLDVGVVRAVSVVEVVGAVMVATVVVGIVVTMPHILNSSTRAETQWFSVSTSEGTSNQVPFSHFASVRYSGEIFNFSASSGL